MRFLRVLILGGIVLIVMAGVAGYFYVHALIPPPENFPVNQAIEITPGSSVASITKVLAENHVVQSDDVLYFILTWNYDPSQIKASVYVFDRPLNTFEVAKRLLEGDFTSNLVSFTHVEGERASDIAPRAAALLPNFDEADFLAQGTPLEGVLFPETYRIPVTYTAEELITLMQEMYEQVVAPLRPAIASSTLTEKQVIILASIIEREANTPESMKMVSGILQNRLAIDMPLQADASIEYVLDKPLQELTPADLKIDSPYNTYTNRGLPPTPIGNPGKAAIEAVLYPTDTDDLFYITDTEGNFHYARTYSEHQINIKQYLR